MKQILIFLLGLFFIGCVTSNGGNHTQDPYLSVVTESVTFSAEGGVKMAQVLSNVDYTLTPNVEWLTAEKGDNYVVKITAEPSKAGAVRNGEIVVENKQYNFSHSIKVSQKAHFSRSWAEMPSMPDKAHLEYCFHDKLPSNNKLRNYSFCFDKEKYCALWVAYPLHECYTEGEGKRTNAWGYDPCCVDDDYEPSLRNAYYPQGGSEYSHSRGHQLPSADRLASNEDNATTFYYSNMTPQLQSLNGGTWASLEDDLRNRWMCSDTLYVVTGAHFEPGYGYAYDQKGTGKACAVPTHYYKVILRTKKGNSGKWVGDCSAGELQCAGFWFVHEGGAQRQIMSVADIESKTGLTFFTNVPNAPKSTYNASDWQ